jgi:hypothetical protein
MIETVRLGEARTTNLGRAESKLPCAALSALLFSRPAGGFPELVF